MYVFPLISLISKAFLFPYYYILNYHTQRFGMM